MTIRDYIKRRVRNLALFLALPYATLQILRVVILYHPDAFPRKVSIFVLMFTDYRVLCVVLAWFALKSDHHSLSSMFPPARRRRCGPLGQPESPSLPELSR